MAIGKTFIQILGPNEQFPNNPGFPTLFLQKKSDVNKTVFGFNDGQGNTFSAFLVLEKGQGPGNKLSKIFDVNAINPSDGQSLIFNAETGKWINGNVTGGTQTEISTSVINWNYTHHYKTLSANTTFTFSNASDAETIIIAITNTANNWTVTWPSGVKWAGGTEPVQTVGVKTDIYTLTQINSIIYGSYIQDLS